MNQICIYFLLFMLYAVCGWMLEVFCKLISHHKFINRGFLIGPYCPIYGFGAIIMTFFLKKYINDPVTLFIMCVLVVSLLEYVTSFVLEKIFKTRWWDYSTYRFSINGRICLETMLPFGIGGIVIMYITNPIFLKFITQLPNWLLYSSSGVLFLSFVVDAILSYRILANLKDISTKFRTDNTEKITKKVKEEIQKRNKKLQKRILASFPKLEILYSKKKKKK